LYPGHIGIDAQGHTRITVAHLGGGDRGVLAQRGVGPAQRVDLPSRLLDRGFGADAVALARLLVYAASELKSSGSVQAANS